VDKPALKTENEKRRPKITFETPSFFLVLCVLIQPIMQLLQFIDELIDLPQLLLFLRNQARHAVPIK
jgi:hypothetical protein